MLSNGKVEKYDQGHGGAVSRISGCHLTRKLERAHDLQESTQSTQSTLSTLKCAFQFSELSGNLKSAKRRILIYLVSLFSLHIQSIL